MSTYNELQRKIAELQIQAEKCRQDEIEEAVSQANALIAKHGLTANDLTFGHSKPASVKRKSGSVSVKYRDQAGNTWTGRGHTPTWLADAEKQGVSRESLLIR